MHQHPSKFTFGDRVQIDGDGSIVALVIAIRFYQPGATCEYEVVWWHDGREHRINGIDEWRLSAERAHN